MADDESSPSRPAAAHPGAPTIAPRSNERPFAELPLDWQVAAVARARRLRGNIHDQRRKQRRRIAAGALSGAVAFTIAAKRIGDGGAGFVLFLALAGAAAGAITAGVPLSGMGGGALFGSAVIVAHFAAIGLGLAAPMWASAFFIWVLMAIAGRFLAEWADADADGF